MDWMMTIALATLMVGLFTWLRRDMAVMRKELRGDMDAMRTELRGDMDAMRTELRSDMDATRTELRGDMDAMRTEFRDDISRLGKEVTKLRERMAHMEGLLDGLREAVAGRRAA